MSAYLEPIQMGVIIFFAFCLIATTPYFIWQYRKNGGVSSWVFFVRFSFVLYLITAYAMTIFPLPDPNQVAKLTTPTENLQLFNFITEFKAHSPLILDNRATWLPALKNWTFYMPFFNFLLCLPFGFYLRYLFKRRFVISSILGFLLSLSFECIQRSALFGLYPRPYRLFDVDDLLINTLGSVFGFLIGCLLVKVLPSLEARQFSPNKVTYTRRSIAYGVDFVLATLLMWLLPNQWWAFTSYFFLPLIFVLLFKRTLGQMTVKIQVTSQNRLLLSLRLILSLLPTLAWFVIFKGLYDTGYVADKHLPQVYLSILIAVVFILISLFDAILGLFNGTRRLWFEKITRTRLVGTQKA